MILFTNVVFPLNVGPAIRIVVGCRNAIKHAIYQCNKCDKIINHGHRTSFYTTIFVFRYFTIINILKAGIRNLEQDLKKKHGMKANAYANHLKIIIFKL